MENNTMEKLKAIKNGTAVSQTKSSLDTLKDERIIKSVALKCAAQMTEAYANIIAATDMVKIMKESEIKEWLKSMKISEFKENIKFLTDQEDESIPF